MLNTNRIVSDPFKVNRLLYINLPFISWLIENPEEFFRNPGNLKKDKLKAILYDSLNESIEGKSIGALEIYRIYNEKIIEKKEKVKKAIKSYLMPIFINGIIPDLATESIPFKKGYNPKHQSYSIVEKLIKHNKDSKYSQFIFWPKTPVIEVSFVIRERQVELFDFIIEEVNRIMEVKGKKGFSNDTYFFTEKLVNYEKAKNFVERISEERRREIEKKAEKYGLSLDDYLRYCIALNAIYIPLARDIYLFEKLKLKEVFEDIIKEFKLKGIPYYAIKGNWAARYLERLSKITGLNIYYIGGGKGILRNEKWPSKGMVEREKSDKALKVLDAFVSAIAEKSKLKAKKKDKREALFMLYNCPNFPYILCSYAQEFENENCTCKEIDKLLTSEEKEFLIKDSKIRGIKIVGIEDLVMDLNCIDVEVKGNKGIYSWRKELKDSLILPFPFETRFRGKYHVRASELNSECDIARIIAKINEDKLYAIAREDGFEIEKPVAARAGSLRHKVINQQVQEIVHNKLLYDFFYKKLDEMGLWVNIDLKTLRKLKRNDYCEKNVYWVVNQDNKASIVVKGKADCCLVIDGKNKALAILDIKHSRFKASRGYLKQTLAYALGIEQEIKQKLRNVESYKNFQNFYNFEKFYLIIAKLSQGMPGFEIWRVDKDDKIVIDLKKEIVNSYKHQKKIIEHRYEFFNTAYFSLAEGLCKKCYKFDECSYLTNKIKRTRKNLRKILEENNLTLSDWNFDDFSDDKKI